MMQRLRLLIIEMSYGRRESKNR